MDEVTTTPVHGPFDTPVEVGLRCLAVLAAAHPVPMALRRLTILDYLVVHSDDAPDGPDGLHPRGPYRGGELLVRRGLLEPALMLYQSRGLVQRLFETDGVFYAATESSGTFLDVLSGRYIDTLRDRAAWAVARFAAIDDQELSGTVDGWLGAWGAEFDSAALWPQEAL